jgi:ABC-type uncharacterized transport system permease subunit
MSLILYTKAWKERLLVWSITSVFLILIMLICSRLWESAISQEQKTLWIWYLVFTEALILSIQPFCESMETEIREKPDFYFLLKPLEYGWIQWAQGFAKALSSFFVLTLVGGICATFLVGSAPFSFQNWLRCLPYCLIALALNTLTVTLIGLGTIWYGHSLLFMTLWKQLLFLCGGLLFPLSIYPEFLQKIFLWTPFPFVLGFQAERILNIQTNTKITLLGGSLIWAILTISLFLWVQKKFVETIR